LSRYVQNVVHPWTFGWDALVAIGTISLATFTYILGRATRRLAVETAEELQAQWRPILVPVEDSIVMLERDLSEIERQIAEKVPVEVVEGKEVATAEGMRRRVEMKIRNIGRGPALDIKVARMPWAPGPPVAAVIAADAEWLLKESGFHEERRRDLSLHYRDLTGLNYVTEIYTFKLFDEEETISVRLTIGEPYVDREIPRPPMADPMMATLPGVRGRLRAAADVLWPPLYVEPVRPFWRRVLYAVEATRIPSSATLSQRIRYGIGRGFTEMHNRDVPKFVPARFGGAFAFWRRLKKSWYAFRRFRGVGLPPVGLYRDEWRTRARMDTAKRRVEEIRRRRRLR
jgi:hypothetical protein